MFFKDNITLYNKYYDKYSDKTLYKRAYLIGVDYQVSKNISVTDKGLLSADSVKVIVPFSANARGKKYIDPFKYYELDEIEKEKFYTFKVGDIIVKEVVDFEITSVKPYTLRELQSKFDDVSIIKAVIKCDFGSIRMRHIELEAE
ncbi:DUF6751 family protein [Clostridioides difficile]|uniref:DUF6751 family protein n=1 Tax=Clostridioides difficile TaxID=1496 RepID=UPI002358C01B|nr:DUF6751 family protein [Clostridioides difficile]MDC9367325.1 hypothetical protein [Clostridioides difficile]